MLIMHVSKGNREWDKTPQLDAFAYNMAKQESKGYGSLRFSLIFMCIVLTVAGCAGIGNKQEIFSRYQKRHLVKSCGRIGSLVLPEISPFRYKNLIKIL